MKLALSALCENPVRQTGLSTMFQGLLAQSLRLYPDLEWIIFAGPNQDLGFTDSRLQVVREFPAGDRSGARGLVTVGFVPLRGALPTFMHITSLQHLSQPSPLAGPAVVRWAGQARRRLRQAYRSWMICSGLRDAALIILNSQTARHQFLETYPQHRDKIIVSHEGTLDQCRPDPAPLYRHALAFSLPSRLETFGRCTMEAMDCGAPCVLNDIPIIREVSGGHALIFDFADRALVVRTLKQICEDEALRRRLRESGLEHARQFTFEQMARPRLDAIRGWFAARESGSLSA